MTKNFIMKYVMESTGGMNAMANSFVDSTMQKVRMNFPGERYRNQKNGS